MRSRKKFSKSGMYRPLRGVKVRPTRQFSPVLETKAGVKVRSKYEVRCADYLYTNGIQFQYEPLMLLKGRQFRPDFYLPEYNLFLEICGYGHMPYYRDRTGHKQRLYNELGLRSAFIHYNGKGSLEELVSEELKKWDQFSTSGV
jgi:DNA helicase-4